MHNQSSNLYADINESGITEYLRLWPKLEKFFIITVSTTLLFNQNSLQAKVNCILYVGIVYSVRGRARTRAVPRTPGPSYEKTKMNLLK